jgi:methylmalonyl-CoA mutase
MRSLATRRLAYRNSPSHGRCHGVAKAAGFDLIIAETAGIGQGDSSIVDLVDLCPSTS